MSSLTLTLWNIVESRFMAMWRLPMMARMRGAFILMLGMAAFASFISYHPTDPSFNVATDGPVLNLMGGFGANLADICLQSVGLAAWPAAILMAYFGLTRLTQIDPDELRGKLRMHALWGAILVLAFAATVAPLYDSADPVIARSLGGFWGSGLNNLLVGLFNFMQLPAAPVIASILFFAL